MVMKRFIRLIVIVIIKSVSEASTCFSNILCFLAILAVDKTYNDRRIMAEITFRYCFVTNANLSCTVDVLANFLLMLSTWFVAMRFTISNSFLTTT